MLPSFNGSGAFNSRRSSNDAPPTPPDPPVDNTNPRNIASAAIAPTLFTTGTTNSQNCKSFHVNESGAPMTRLQVGYSNWIIGNGITNGSNSFNVSASVVIGGTPYQFLWGGSVLGTVSVADKTKASDWLDVPEIAAGASFFIITHVEVTGSNTFPLTSVGGISVNTSLGEAAERTNGLADKTMSGTISGTTTALRPSFINGDYVVGMRPISGATIGDSTPFGSGDSRGESDHGNYSFCGYAADGRSPWLMCATGTGLLADDIDGNMDEITDLLTKAGITHTWISAAANDFGAGATAAQMQTRATSIINAVKAIPNMYASYMTCGPRADTVDGVATAYYTVANQTPRTPWNGASADAHVFNDLLRAGLAGLDDVFDKCDLLSTTRYSGVFRTGTDNPEETRLQPPVSGTITGSPTTTNYPITPSLPTGYSNYLTNGRIVFAAGGTASPKFDDTGIGNSTTAFTNSSGVSVAPSAGETITGYPSRACATRDGTHAYGITSTVSAFNGLDYGGQLILQDAFATLLDSLN